MCIVNLHNLFCYMHILMFFFYADMAESNEGSTSQTTSTSNSEGKRKRGPTEMNQIQIKKRKGKMIKVLFNSKGEASGQAGKQLASYTGVVARTFIPITINSWSDVDDQLKEKVWTEITVILIS